MDEKTLESYRAYSDELLKKHVKTYLPETPLSKACAYALLNGGKRLRSSIVLMLADALGKGFDTGAAAIGVEIFHCASLVADDMPCMDDDDIRRGNPATHKAFGEGLALLASYALIADGYGCISRCSTENTGLSADVCRLALECAAYNTGLPGATGGQFLDIFPPQPLVEEGIREIHQKKTVSLFEIAFVYGWLFGGGEESFLPEVKALAHSFGMAFQIADDLDDREQDLGNERAVNFSTCLGEREALEAVEEELKQYREGLKKLKIETPALKALANQVQAGLSSNLCL